MSAALRGGCRARAAIAAMAVAAMLGWLGAGARPARAKALPASVSLGSGGVRVPSAFFGISVEYKELATFEQGGPLFDRFLSMVHSRDGSQLLFRIGGKSADHVWWGTGEKPPKYTTVLDQSWLTGLSDLVRRDNLRVMLDLNLAVHSATMATQFATAVSQALPAQGLAGLEVGNEPDLYWRQQPLENERVNTTGRGIPLDWANDYSALDYRRDYLTYARYLKAKLPSVPLGGPETISSKPDWLAVMSGLGSLSPGFITIHRYAASTCWPKTSPWYPTIPLILDDGVSSGLAGTVQSAVSFAHARGIALRLTEVNSVSCGGNTGVTDSFATALWALDTLFAMVQAGVDGISWHIRPKTVNAPFHFVPGGIQPLPELYALALFARMTRGPASVLGIRESAPPALHVHAYAVRSRRSLEVLLINKGATDANVAVKLGSAAGSAATVQTLTAPSIGSSTGVTLAGQTIGPDVRWQGPRVSTPVTPRRGTYGVSVPHDSAAVLTVG